MQTGALRRHSEGIALDAENETLRATIQTLKELIFGARSETLEVFSQPRPVETVTAADHWTVATILSDALPKLKGTGPSGVSGAGIRLGVKTKSSPAPALTTAPVAQVDESCPS